MGDFISICKLYLNKTVYKKEKETANSSCLQGKGQEREV